MDYILFCYGLAFALLYAVCGVLARARSGDLPWRLLGHFALAHAGNEWLDMVAAIVGDRLWLASLRFGLLVVSFVFLLEFARQATRALGRAAPGPWVYLPLFGAICVGGWLGGAVGVAASARLSLGLLASAWTALVFVLIARGGDALRAGWAASVASGFGLYAILAGLVTPLQAAWLPAVLTQRGFLESTGIPVQLLRGACAAWIAVSVWGLRTEDDVSASAQHGPHSAHDLRGRFLAMLGAIGFILLAGWIVTVTLGRFAEDDSRVEAQRDIAMLGALLSQRTGFSIRMAEVLARQTDVRDAAAGRPIEAAQTPLAALLDAHRVAAGAVLAAILAPDGHVLAASGATPPGLDTGGPWLREALAGTAVHAFGPGLPAVFIVAEPVRDAGLGVTGVAVLFVPLTDVDLAVRQFEGAWLVDARGRTVIGSGAAPGGGTSGAGGEFTWQVSGSTRACLASGDSGLAGYRFVLASEGWGIRAARTLGIAFTFLVALLVLYFFSATQRAMREQIRMAQQLELEERAHRLSLQATVDPLTGVFNRLKFDHALEEELRRAERYGLPLSLVMFDIDHFKHINDTHGHHAGDRVLVEICRIVASQIRKSDLLARWGGEEFMVLCANCDEEAAVQLAQKIRVAIEDARIDRVGGVTCSFGVAAYRHGDSADSMCIRVDEAMYEAKRAGRNRVEAAAAR